VKLAADASVLLSALMGGQAKRVLRHPAIEEIPTAEVTLAEAPAFLRSSRHGTGRGPRRGKI